MNQELDIRKEKGLAIAQTRRIKNTGDHRWSVPSQFGTGLYRVSLSPENTYCTCPDFDVVRKRECKHIFAARFTSNPGLTNESTRIMRPTYSQNWPAYDKAQIFETEHVEHLLKELLMGVPEEPYNGRGRPPTPLRAGIYAACMKVYTGKSGRRASTAIRRCGERGLIVHAPHHSAISQLMLRDDLTPILQGLISETAKPLVAFESQFAIDATGLQATQYGRWLDEKFAPRRKEWVKFHAVVGCKSNIIAAVRITESNVHDTVMLPELFEETVESFRVDEFSADKGYLSQKNLHLIEGSGVEAYIPFKVDSRPNGSETWKRLFHAYHFRYPEWAEKYHQRSNSEAVFGSLKRLLGGKLRSKKFRSRVNEALCMTILYNLIVLVHQMYEIGLDPVFPTLDPGSASEGQVLH